MVKTSAAKSARPDENNNCGAYMRNQTNLNRKEAYLWRAAKKLVCTLLAALLLLACQLYPAGGSQGRAMAASSPPGARASGDVLEAAVYDVAADSKMDFGDLPAGYSLTLLEDDGPCHTVGALRLGVLVDMEPNGQENPYSNGDGPDDDGVVRTPDIHWREGEAGGSVNLTTSGCASECAVNAWIDWNRDNDFLDLGEKILYDYPVSNGTQTITFRIPMGVSFAGNFNARFRLYTAPTKGLASPTGLSGYGEVEDYQWPFGPTAIRLSSLQAAATPRLPVIVLICACLLLLLWSLFVMKRGGED